MLIQSTAIFTDLISAICYAVSTTKAANAKQPAGPALSQRTASTTNLAARFQSLTRDLAAAVVMDALTYARAGDVAAGFESCGAVSIRGCRERKEVYSLGIEAERAS